MKWAIITIFFLLAGGFVFYRARGLRNNNPGNIRHSGSQWKGARATQTDHDFVQFIGSEWGLRALFKTLRTYANVHGLDTVQKIVSRYAPSADNNDTASYVGHVASAIDVQPNERIDVESKSIDLVKAIIKHEQGVQPFSDNFIREAYKLSLT